MIDIGGRRELFVDDFLIDRLEGVRHTLHHPERREVVLTCDAPWESGAAAFYSIVEDEGVIRLFYRASSERESLKVEPRARIAIAESRDGGVSFSRPSLGRIEYEGSTDNNLIGQGDFIAIPPAFLDTNPDCPYEHRYKGLTSQWRELYAMSSPDGITWKLMQDEPVLTSGTFDTINTAFWDPSISAYRSFTRFFADADLDAAETDLLGAGTTAVRSIQSSTSEDFLHWTDPVPHSYRDAHPRTQLYTNSTIRCPGAEHIYLAFPNRYVQHRVPDPEFRAPGVNDSLFMCSRDCTTWTRYLEAWVRPGLDPYNWTARNNYPTWGIVETSATEWSMYISEHYMREEVPVRIRRLSVRPWGFASIHGDYEGGTCLTKPFVFDGDDLMLNCSTSAAGSIRVSVLTEAGMPIDGYDAEEMDEYFGDSLSAPVRWKGERRIGALAGKPVRLRFELKDADVFSFQVCG